jgi:hypothetical protein
MPATASVVVLLHRDPRRDPAGTAAEHERDVDLAKRGPVSLNIFRSDSADMDRPLACRWWSADAGVVQSEMATAILARLSLR